MGKALGGVTALHGFLGDKAMLKLAQTAHQLSGKKLPQWNRFMPTGVNAKPKATANTGDAVVYFPACVSRTMGPAKNDPMGEPLFQATIRLLEKGGYKVFFPEKMNRLCCGQPFDSKGLFDQAQTKADELEAALMKVSDNGRIPILCDTSPCLYRMRTVMDQRLKLYEPVEFIHDYMLDRLDILPCDDTVAIHTTCSSRKMGLEEKFKTVAKQCVAEVIVPDDVYCCGFAGDKGFTHPELNASALKDLSGQVADQCDAGYSNSRTCEVGLSLHSGLFYRSIVYLVDRQSTPI
jgi:D-lactate dehydrogenase